MGFEDNTTFMVVSRDWQGVPLTKKGATTAGVTTITSCDPDCPCFDGDTDRYSRNTDMKIEDCACYDRCDTTSSGCKHTCDVLVNQMGYECDKMYCPTCKYAGWCDKTCGYAKCAK